MKRVPLRLAAALIFCAALSPVVAMAGSAATRNIEVYRDPSCGCCGAWIRYLRTHVYTMTVHEHQSMAALIARLDVPAAAASCHTALIGGYVIEGHVPAQDIRRLLAEHPDVRGLAVPGMPMGSPGMEMGASVHYDVLLIGRDGSTRVFASHGPRA